MTGATHRFRTDGKAPQPQGKEVWCWRLEVDPGWGDVLHALANLAADYDALKAKADAMAEVLEHALGMGLVEGDADLLYFADYEYIRSTLTAYREMTDAKARGEG